MIDRVVLGATKLPRFGDRANASPSRPSRRTSADWLLLAATILCVSVAVVLEIWTTRASLPIVGFISARETHVNADDDPAC